MEFAVLDQNQSFFRGFYQDSGVKSFFTPPYTPAPYGYPLLRKCLEKVSKPARAIYGCKTIGEANAELNKAGIRTELDIETELYEKLKSG